MELLRRHVEETWRRVRIISIVVAFVILYYLSTWYLSALSSAAAAAAAAARAGSPGDNTAPQLAHSTVPRDIARWNAGCHITRVSLPACALPACPPPSLPPSLPAGAASETWAAAAAGGRGVPATQSPTAWRAHAGWEGGGVSAAGAGADESDASAGARQDQRSRSDESSRSEPFESRASGERGGGAGAGWAGGEGWEREGDAEL